MNRLRADNPAARCGSGTSIWPPNHRGGGRVRRTLVASNLQEGSTCDKSRSVVDATELTVQAAPPLGSHVARRCTPIVAIPRLDRRDFFAMGDGAGHAMRQDERRTHTPRVVR